MHGMPLDRPTGPPLALKAPRRRPISALTYFEPDGKQR